LRPRKNYDFFTRKNTAPAVAEGSSVVEVGEEDKKGTSGYHQSAEFEPTQLQESSTLLQRAAAEGKNVNVSRRPTSAVADVLGNYSKLLFRPGGVDSDNISIPGESDEKEQSPPSRLRVGEDSPPRESQTPLPPSVDNAQQSSEEPEQSQDSTKLEKLDKLLQKTSEKHRDLREKLHCSTRFAERKSSCAFAQKNLSEVQQECNQMEKLHSLLTSRKQKVQQMEEEQEQRPPSSPVQPVIDRKSLAQAEKQLLAAFDAVDAVLDGATLPPETAAEGARRFPG